MRNYVIINGVNSTTINGLAINEMPPITKPSIRTNTEEIDGRDGDIVTRLGYSAYDKEMTIGLYGSYDLDEIMSYFNQSGTIIFSTETDKYYNFEILEQIDYEKLLKFKTATITMHCQPFKYEVNETPVEIEVDNVTGTGETITLDNTTDASLKIDLKGNTSQEGTPTPDTPVEVETVTGNQEIVVCGKNLFDEIFRQGSWNNLTATNRVFTANELYLEAGETFTFKTNLDLSVYKYGILVNDSSFPVTTLNASVDSGWLPTNTYTFNTTRDGYFGVNIAKLDNGNITTSEVESFYFQLYNQEQSYPINLGDIELCKIGDYQDRIYKDSGKWYLEKKIGKYICTGNEVMNLQNNGKRIYIDSRDNSIPDPLHTPSTSTKYGLYSDKLVEATAGQTWGGVQGISYDYNTGKNTGNFDISINGISTLADYRTAIVGIIVYYILETPTTTEITDTELISQLNAIENARSYDTTTNITQNTNNLPFLLTASTIEKGSNEGVITNEGNIYSRPTLTIEGTGVGGIYLNNNQMFNIDLTNSNLCVIDTTNLEAYNPNTNQLMNRQVTGDYDDFKLNVGNSNIKIDGSITKVTITNYSRWL